MKTNNEQIFDELMRQKLSDYSEEPDMDLMGNIQLKKNRLINVYSLYRVLAIFIIVGLSTFGGYLLLHNLDNNNSSGNTNTIAQVPQSRISNYYTNSFSEDASTTNRNNYTNASITSYIPNNISTKSTINTFTNDKINTRQNTTKLKSTASKKVIITPTMSKNNELNKETKSTIEAIRKPATNTTENKQKEISSVTCKALFDYYVSFDGKVSFTNFSQVAESGKMKWNFGDGSTSEDESPSHLYKVAGNYNVSLNVIDEKNKCANHFDKVIVFGNAAPQKDQRILLSGKVTGNSSSIYKASVLLMQYDKEKNKYIPTISAITNMSGEFTFTDLTSGRYLILANANDAQFLPTFWGNAIDVADALDIQIIENDNGELKGYNILLASNKDLSQSNIPKVLSIDTIGSSSTYFIYDKNNVIVGVVKGDISGNATVNSLPSGNYNLINQQTGKTIQISVSDKGVIEPTNYGDGKTTLDEKITLIPNPASNNFKFDVNSQHDAITEITIINTNGATVFHGFRLCSTGENSLDVDISNLPPGVYYVIATVGGKQSMHAQLIKSVDNTK